MSDSNDLKIVRVKNGRGFIFSLRRMIDGLETELACGQLTDMTRLRGIAENMDNSGVVLLSALLSIRPLAEMIESANCDQGNAGYATKSHMAEWGEWIKQEIDAALNATGVLAKVD